MLTVRSAARRRPAIVISPVRLPRTLVLVGLMGAGKTAIGRRLAARFGLPFIDADQEIEEAAGCSVADIFERYGEPAFRDVERRVIARLLHEPVHVLATGGGAFMDERTRALIAERGISLWLRADLEVLLARTGRRSDRPLLRDGNPRDILARLKTEREPIYARADVVVDSLDGPPEETVERAMLAVERVVGERRFAPVRA
jgi:shikimate kinase